MKKASLIFCISLASLFARADELTTNDGKKHTGEISRIEPDGVVMTTGDGIEKIRFDELPADVQKKYNYDPLKASAFSEAVAEAQRANNERTQAVLIQQQQAAQLAEAQKAVQIEKNGFDRGEAARHPVIEAKGLIALYDQNEIAADQAFKGKAGPVRGTITDISRDILGTPFVLLDNGVECSFPKNAETQLTDLSKGQVVVILGKIRGKTLGLVLMDKCSLLP